jgi:predicted DsbA family dithiol-disulfide isomerase
LDVISDVVCPWCYIGKRRLEKALATAGIPAAVRWRPYQLDATIPPKGKNRRAYLEAKFRSSERIREMQARLAFVGAEEGIGFAFDRIEVSPNTLDAHRLIRWAEEARRQEQVVEALFRAFFIEGRNLADSAVLAEIAGRAGMDKDDIAIRLASNADREEVRAEIESAQMMGVSSVPTFIFANRYALVGAQPAETIAATLAQVRAA